MPLEHPESLSIRKREHIEICLSGKAGFKYKKSGFEMYDFVHSAATETAPEDIDLSAYFVNKDIRYPFMISCMTGGTMEAENINARLAEAARELNVILGVGSQRHALENRDQHSSYKIIRQNAPDIPVVGNIGAAQLITIGDVSKINYLAEIIDADAMALHLNAAQELFQRNGEPGFPGLLKKVEELVKTVNVPVIVKEVGAGIDKESGRRLLEAGVFGLDTAGAGGTSWTGVEILRNNGDDSNEFWDWGNPTTYCIRKLYELKSKYDFLLIGSGGINTGIEAAKAYALGADITASARKVLTELDASGPEGVVKLINEWFNTVKNVMYLTGSADLKELRNNKLIKKEEHY